MGGTNFFTTATGKTAQEAYDNACRDAAYEYGHGGYSGTIKEKAGYVEFSFPGLTAEELDKALSSYAYQDQEVIEPPKAKAIYTRKVRAQLEQTASTLVPVGAKPPAEPETPYLQLNTRGAVVTSANKWHVTIQPPDKWEIDAYEAQQKVAGNPNLKRAADVYDDKWGPAVCVRVGDNEFAFMGIASC